MQIDELEKLADILDNRIKGWENHVLETIGRRIKSIGSLSVYDAEALKNLADITGDMQGINQQLSEITGQNIRDLYKIYQQAAQQNYEAAEHLYKYRGLSQIPFAQNIAAQKLIQAFVVQSGKDMLNLSQTKALGFGHKLANGDFVFKGMAQAYKDTVDKAIYQVSSGTLDFNSAMRRTMEDLGGSGIRVNYGTNSHGRLITRRLDTSVRQNILWGAKQQSQELEKIMGQELSFDIFFVDYHPYARPSHEFMGGMAFSYSDEVSSKGEHYPNGKNALERLKDYGCKHFITGGISGVSKNPYDPKQLVQWKKRDVTPIEYNGVKKMPYEWTQEQRILETEIRKARDQEKILKAAGDTVGMKSAQNKASKLTDKYNNLSKQTGLKKELERLIVR